MCASVVVPRSRPPGTGAPISRLTNDVTRVQDAVLMLLRIMVRTPLLLKGSLLMAVLTGPRLDSLYTLLIPVVAATVALIINRTLPSRDSGGPPIATRAPACKTEQDAHPYELSGRRNHTHRCER